MPEPRKFIVGRQSEVERFDALVNGRLSYWLLNIFGPGGIGKTVVGQKIRTYARHQDIPLAFLDGVSPNLAPDSILNAIKEGISETEALADSFRDFNREYEEYLIIQNILQHGGGINTLFDVVGNVKDPKEFAQLIESVGQSVTEKTQRKLGNRFVLERYLRGIERSLTHNLVDSLNAAVAISIRPPTILIDTYEEMEGLDDWICHTLAPALPESVKVVVLGRNALPKINYDWGEFGPSLEAMELPELPENDAKAYLVHHGLQDTVALDEMYRFTGGYPLLLVLVVHLSREAGGWEKIGTLESMADRDHVATELLKRILREERVTEVQTFLEKGVVARWFTPEAVSVILEITPEEGRAIYDKLKRHSFVERHPYGLKFHDKIRELLLARLKFNRPEYDRIVNRLTDYYAEKAGIKQETGDETAESTAAKYNIHIHNSANIVIGDEADVSQTPDET